MKLAYLSSSKLPSREANSIHVMKMCQAFARLGHEVTLLAPDVRTGLEPGVAEIHSFYGVERCFELRKLPWRSVKGRGWVYGFEAGQEARRLGVDLAFGRSLHACAVAARLGVPTIFDAHMLSFLLRPHERWLFHWMIRAPAFRHMSTNCGSLADCVIERVPEMKGRIVAAHNGADPPPEGLKPAKLERNGRPQVGYIGQLYPGKGYEIVPPLAERLPFADFHVVGGDRERVEALRADPNLPSNLHLHGFVPPAETERLCLAFDVMLAPYQAEVRIAGGGETAAWMSPLKVFGYMAAAKPIVCSDLPVLREVVEDGRNGLLVQAEDPDAWAAALRCLLEDRELRERLSATAFADFLARHTWRGRASQCLGEAAGGRANADTQSRAA